MLIHFLLFREKTHKELNTVMGQGESLLHLQMTKKLGGAWKYTEREVWHFKS